MKIFFKTFLLISFLFCAIEANEYREIKIIKLKKDEHKKILVKYDKIQKLFKFRWTLYANGGLVILRSYDRIVAQNILYLRHKNQSFRLDLQPRGFSVSGVPYILVKFKEFDYETNEAIFEMFLSDDKLKVRLKYLENS